MSEFRVIVADVLDGLAQLDAGSVQTCITSPPYWGLRDYGTATWDGGEAGCPHRVPATGSTQNKGNNGREGRPFVVVCGLCGATRIDSQLGLEPTPEAYVERMVDVFREVRRVLRDDGTVWLNLGDSYIARQQGWGLSDDRSWAAYHKENGDERERGPRLGRGDASGSYEMTRRTGLAPKQLVGIPWRVAFALQADGWYLRSDIIWAKPNPMPESVTDRPTKSHEYLFLLTKSARYYFDADAVRDQGAGRLDFGRMKRPEARLGEGGGWLNDNGHKTEDDPAGRNIRTVWNVATEPFPGAHFATFPKKLIEPCVKAGTSEKGCCAECGAAWVGAVERQPLVLKEPAVSIVERRGDGVNDKRTALSGTQVVPASGKTLGWEAACDHDAEPVPCTVLDPFCGSGTTGLVALRHQRDFIGIELNPEYAEMARDRIRNDGPLFNVEAV